MGDPGFELRLSANPSNTYRIVWYRDTTGLQVKVDVLHRPVMDIPWIPEGRFEWFKNKALPVMPLLPLLLMRLKTWDDHRNSPYENVQEKQHTDVKDLRQLLAIAIKERSNYAVQRKDAHWLPNSFVTASEGRLRNLKSLYPDMNDQWAFLGF